MRRVLKVMCTCLALTVIWPDGVSAQSCSSTVGSPPGRVYPLFDWRETGGGLLPQMYAYYLAEDIIRIDVEDGAPLGLRPTQMQIKLVTRFREKQVTAWNRHSGPTQVIRSPELLEGTIETPPDGFFRRSMRVSQSVCGSTADTIVLRKAGFLGIYYDMYHFDLNNFWGLWGGKIVTINWISQSYAGSYPPPCASPCVPVGTVPRTWPADRVVFRPSTGQLVADTGRGILNSVRIGSSEDVVTRGFYDADGLSDIATWRPSTGEWQIIYSASGQVATVWWGEFGDVPVPGDYYGDGKTDLATWRPSTGEWFVIDSATGQRWRYQWGDPGDIPIVADFDGDRKVDFTIWRPSTGVWWTLRSTDGGVQNTWWGAPGDVPVAGDFDGDGRAEPAIWRPSTGVWWISFSAGGLRTQQWGLPGDVPIPGDFDHDGRADLGIWRPSTGRWQIIHSSGAQTFHPLGTSGDIPLPPAP